MSELLLPLFPLEVVLFPGASLPLHIFEERYKQMISECLENKKEFGVVLLQDNKLEMAGCTASIEQVLEKYDDGRLEIVVRGQRRFEILVLDRAKPYLRGAPQFFDDETEAVPADDVRRRRALELRRKVVEMLRSQGQEIALDPPGAEDPQLSFQILATLPVSLAFKQTLLESRSESERLTQVVSYLQQLTERLQIVLRARDRAGGNGRSR